MVYEKIVGLLYRMRKMIMVSDISILFHAISSPFIFHPTYFAFDFETLLICKAFMISSLGDVERMPASAAAACIAWNWE